MKNIINRFKNPIFLTALVGFIYQVLTQLGVHIDNAMWKNGIDLLSNLVIGVGIYSSFGTNPPSSDNKGE